MSFDKLSRRKYVKGTATVGIAGLAGCLGGGGGQNTSGGNGSGGGGNGSGGGGNGSGGDGSPWVHDISQQSSQTITYNNSGGLDGDPATVAVMKNFEEESGLEVNPQIFSPESVLDYTRTRLQAESTKLDCYYIYDTILNALGSTGYFEEVSQFIDDESVNGWAEPVREANTLPHDYMQDFPYRDGIYAVPIFDAAWVPFVHMPVLQEAGYDPNTEINTFSRYKEIARDIKESTNIQYPVIFPFSSPGEGGNIYYDLVVRSGGQFFDGRTPTFTSDAVRQATDFFLSLFREELAPRGVTSLSEGRVTQQFFQGNAGLMVNGSANITLPGKELPVDVAAEEVARITTYPKPEGVGDTPTQNMTPTSLGLSIFSKNKRNAVKFMNAACSREAHKKQLLMEGNIALYPSIYDDQEVKENVPYSQVLKETVAGGTNNRYPAAGEMWTTIYSTMQNAISTGMSTDETVQRLQQQAENVVGN